MFRHGLVAAAFVATTGFANAGEVPASMRFVPADGFAFVTQRVDTLFSHPALKPMLTILNGDGDSLMAEDKRQFGLKIDEIERTTVFYPKADSEPLPRINVITLRRPMDKLALLRAMRAHAPAQARAAEGDPLPRETLVIDLNAAYYHPHADTSMSLIVLDERSVALIPTPKRTELEGVMTYLSQMMRQKNEGPLSDALRVSGDHVMVVGVDPARLRTLLPVPGLEPLWDAEAATVTVGLSDVVTLTATIRFRDAQAATKGVKAVEGLQKVASGQLRVIRIQMEAEPVLPEWLVIAKLFDRIQEAVAGAKINLEGHRVHLIVSTPVDATLTAGIQASAVVVNRAGNRIRYANNFKTIGLAMHEYHDDVDCFPGDAYHSKDGKPLLSWRVALLPALKEGKLYDQFHLDEPWDSPHNLKLLEKMPGVFATPGVKLKKPGMTHVQGFVGHQAFFKPWPGRKFAEPGIAWGRRYEDVSDGLSNTLMLVAAADAVPWTKPADIPFDGKKIPKLGGHYAEGFTAVFADGSVHFLRPPIPPVMFRRMIDPQDGEVVDFDRILPR